MVADIARVTYDPSRQYRALIRQQGRVTLEADGNEASAIAVESLRLETIDIFGPAAAFGDGYKVVVAGLTITISPGVFYLGGWRLKLDAPVDWAQQPDWIDAPTAALPGGNQVIALLVTEQSVSPVEDQALREVALGGPDSAARDRLMQHFLRVAIDGDSCAAGASTIAGLLAEDGVSIDPATLQLVSAATLQVGFVPGPAVTDPCTPAAAGGYLGADNQMVRVTVTAYDPAAGTGALLWGWNNASLLYRATASDPVTLTLTNVPVDEEHAPQLGQMVEILRTEADLGDNNLIADNQGFVTSLAQAYSFDTGEIVLADALPAEFQNNKYPLFVRLWQASVPFTAGQATPLDTVSGITVTVMLPALPSHVAARPYWNFAVRPATPQAIYPQRYLDAPQPPDGPRQWIADLAIVQESALGGPAGVVADCRAPWNPNGQETCDCCGFTLDPEAVAARGGLQAVIDGLAGSPARLSLKTGTYTLAQPLVVTNKHAGLTIEGCTDGVILQAGTGDPTPFLLGLVQFSAATDITLRKLEFLPPAVPANVSGLGLNTLLCIGVQSCQALTIEQCLFNLVIAPATAAFGSGILVYGPSGQVSVRRNTFVADVSTGMFGVLALVSGANVSSGLDQWEISDNRFTNLWVAVLAFADLGLIRCCRNVVTDCVNGFTFAESNVGKASSFTRTALQESAAGRNVALGQAANAALRADLLVDIVQKAAPFFAAMPPPGTPAAVSDVARQVLKDQLTASGLSAYRTLTGATGAPQTAAAASVEGASVDLSNFDKLDAISVAAEVSAPALMPALRIDDNDLTLTTGGSPAWAGVVVVLSTEQPANLIVNGNRVRTPAIAIPACAVELAGAAMGAVVTGNLFLQPANLTGATANPCLILLGQEIMVSANVVRSSEIVLPPRTIQPAPGWDFLNTLG